MIFSIKKECCLDQKNGVLEKSKKSTFCKGVSALFLSKNRTFYHLCFLGKSSQKRSRFDVLDKKECFLDRKKELLKSPKKSKFFKGVSPLFVIFVFRANQATKNQFLKFLIKKNSFQTRKRKFSKSLTNGNFLKGLVHGFRQKIEHFIRYVSFFFPYKVVKDYFWS